MAINNNTKVLLISLIVIVGTSIGIYYGFIREKPEDEEAEIVLTLLKGETSIDFTMEELKALDSIRGFGGYKKTTGTLEGPNEYKGITIEILLQQASGMEQTNDLIVTAIDNYRATYTYNMVQGKVTTYDPETGNETEIEGDMQMILIYEEIGEQYLSGGPLRIGYINDDGNLTDSTLWTKSVRTIEIVESTNN